MMSPFLQKILRFVAGLAILFVGVFAMKGLIGMKESPSVTLPDSVARPVKTQLVINSVVSPKVPVEGRVEAWQSIDIFSEVNGVLQIGGLEFREGKAYKKGDIILKLDDGSEMAKLQGQRSQFQQLVTGILSNIRIDFPERIDEWELFVMSIDVNNIIPSLPKPTSDREKNFIVSHGVVASFHAIRATEELLSKFTFRAPFDGVVTSALVKPGSLVRAGQPIGTFVGSGVYEIKTAVHARFLESVREGDAAAFTNENGDIVATGIIDRVSSNVDVNTQSATVFCKVNNVEGFENQLRDGRYLSGELTTMAIENSTELPLSLLNSDNEIYIVDSGTLKKLNVEVVFRSFESVIVQGIPDGISILAEPISGAYDGLKVSAF